MATRREVLGWLGVLALAGTVGPVSAAQGNGTQENPLDVVIVGGGMSGLTAAWLLKGEDASALVLERESVAGGRTISGKWSNFSYPKGTEYIGAPESVVKSLLTQLKLTAIPIPAPQDAVSYQSKTYSGTKILDFFSGKASDDYDRLGTELKAFNESAIETAIYDTTSSSAALAAFKSLDEKSMGAWLKERNFDPQVIHLVDVENRGLFGAANDDLSLLYNIPETAWNMFDPEETVAKGMYTFAGGMSDVIAALINAMPDQVKTGAEVTQVAVVSPTLVAVTYRKDSVESTVWAKKVLFTTPAPVTARLAGSGLSPVVRGVLNSIRYAPYITLNLFLSQRVWRDAWTLSCLDSYFVTLYDVVRTQVAADYNGNAILGVYLAPERADDIGFHSLSETEVMDKTLQGLLRFSPDIAQMVKGHDLFRFRYAFPVFRPGYLSVIQTLETDPTTRGPLYLAGDYMVYPTFDGAAKSARKALKLMGWNV